MSPLIRSRSTTRRSARHHVDMPCEVITQHSDEPRLLWATDMSAEGAWIDLDTPLSLGEELVICFKPSVWWRAKELMLFAEVTRCSPGLRGPEDNAGMGMSFIDLANHEHFALRKWLRPRPHVAPRRRVPQRLDDVMLHVAAASPFASRIDW